VFEWPRIPELIRMAFREMWAGRPGPVQLEVPLTPLYATGDPATAPIYPRDAGRSTQPQISDSQLGAAADLLANANAPLIFAGCGVDRGGANAALLHLAELLNCPVIPSLAGRSVVPHDHPLCFVSQSPAADDLRQHADVQLVVGSRLGNLDVPFDKYWGDVARNKLIQIDIDPRHIGVSRPVSLGIVAEARTALEGLTTKLRSRDIKSRGRTDLAPQRSADTAWAQSIREPIAAWQGPGIHPGQVMGMIGATFGRDAVYCVDGGMTSLWAIMALPSTRPSSFHGILELGMLGVGIPAAIGSKLGAPSRDVVCVTGDGAAGFNIMELQTAVREGLKVTVVVMADGEWTMEVPNEMARWGKTFGTHMGAIRWDTVAQGLGAHGEYVESMADLAPALARTKAHDGPALLCVRTSTAANLAMPKSIGGRFFEVYFGPTP
jgi:acetolactate synthase-1/2/3 large subunit